MPKENKKSPIKGLSQLHLSCRKKAAEVTNMGQLNYDTKKRKFKQLSERERYQIEVLIKEGRKPSEIGIIMNRDRRTIEREIKRGSVVQLESNLQEKILYCADVGQRVKQENDSGKGRGLKIGNDHELAKYIEDKIVIEGFSPYAALEMVKREGNRFKVSICVKTLYNYIETGIFAELSNKHLPVKKKVKRGYRKVSKVALNNLKGRSIEERPEDVDLREEIGHWEMDCVVGKGKTCLLVLTERSSRVEIIERMPCKTQEEVIKVLNKLERKYKKEFPAIFKTITMDNGTEFLDMTGLETSCLNKKNKRTVCYYAHPYSSWERGTNEVNNKLIRRFIPKGSDISTFKKSEIKRIESWMNNYPRKMFDGKTSNEIYNATAA